MIFIERYLKLSRSFERALCVAAFLALTAVLFGDVLWREITGSGLHWASEAGLYANVVLVMAGFGLAGAADAHLRPRFADQWLPASWEPLIQRIGYVLTALFCGVVCAATVSMVADTLAFDERSVQLGWPVWLPQLLLPLAFGSACLRYLVFAVRPQLAKTEVQEPAK